MPQCYPFRLVPSGACEVSDGPGKLGQVTNPRSAWFLYIVLRLLFFVVPFAVLMLLGIWPWLSAVFAGLIGVSLSVIFLAKPRATASESIYDWRNRDRTADDIVEDEAVDGVADPEPAAVGEGAEASEATGEVAADTVGDPEPLDDQGTRA